MMVHWEDSAGGERGQGDLFHKADARRYPPSLLKATVDSFDYALKLTTGEIIRFESATIHGDYVTLSPGGGDNGSGFNDGRQARHPHMLSHPCPRGVDVRVDQIVWCADAPEGS